MADRNYDVFDRTPEEKQRAYERLVALRGGEDTLELAVCSTCGNFARWDSELYPGGAAGGCSSKSGEHFVTRVVVRALPPESVT